MSSAALEALLEGLVDYAGLFPPAALNMQNAVEKFAEYRESGNSRMLARFVVPAARLDEFRDEAERRIADGDQWRLSVLAGHDDINDILEFNSENGSNFRIDTIEARSSDVEGIWKLATAYDSSFTVYVEIPVDDDPTHLIGELAARAMRAKIRTGGITPEAFPSPGNIVRFMSLCARHGVQFKATAGLHHPVCGEYPLTYETGSARETMYGFLNLFLGAALLFDGAEERDVEQLLQERDPKAIKVSDNSIRWRTHELSAVEIENARAEFAGSFGSCSFEEPVDDLSKLNLLPRFA